MLWRLRAGMPCNNKPKFTINNVSQWPPPLAAGSCGSGAHVGKESAPGTWQDGWSKENPLAAGYHCYEPLVLRQIPFLLLVPPQKCCRSLLCCWSCCWKQKAWTLAGLLGHLLSSLPFEGQSPVLPLVQGQWAPSHFFLVFSYAVPNSVCTLSTLSTLSTTLNNIIGPSETCPHCLRDFL